MVVVFMSGSLEVVRRPEDIRRGKKRSLTDHGRTAGLLGAGHHVAAAWSTRVRAQLPPLVHQLPNLGNACAMKYGVAWLVGVPTSIILLWFVVNQVGCGF
jgi:hypothetical protein